MAVCPHCQQPDKNFFAEYCHNCNQPSSFKLQLLISSTYVAVNTIGLGLVLWFLWAVFT